MSLLSSQRFIAFVALSWLAAGCAKCGNSQVVTKDACLGVAGVQPDHLETCTATSECGEFHACKPVKDRPDLQCCRFVGRQCNTEADCCPGQGCQTSSSQCVGPTSPACTTDADCGDDGDKFCDPYTGLDGPTTRCQFKPCGPNKECADGLSCFQGNCVATLPCNGSCEAGKACEATNNLCQDYASPTGRPQAACPMTCAPGFIATFKDGRNIWDACKLSEVACVCGELPSLQSNDVGRFSALASDPGKALYVSAYDGKYGDLVVVTYGIDGKKSGIQYVDGVPNGEVKYGPSGSRGGVVEPGPDVGRYTDIAVSQGKVYVSYYDVTLGNLKMALRSTTGEWTTHQVDGDRADLGLYSSIAIDSAGVPGISYFQRGGEATFNVMDCPIPRPTGAVKYVTALKFARATKAEPTSAADWQIKTIACMSRPPPICDACTGVCADSGNGPTCLPMTTGCTQDGGMGCDSKSSCVTVSGNSVCAKTVTPPNLQQVGPGVGLFSSLAFKDKDAIIAYLQRTVPTTGAADGDLYAVTVASSGAVGAPVLIDSQGDTGYFPDVKIEPQTLKVAIGYHDFTSKAFKFYFANQIQTGVTPEIIDPGDDTSPGNQGWVGTDSSIFFGPIGVVWAVYQDATRGDLKLAKRSGSWTVQPERRTEGAVGFFADGLAADGMLYASHARIRAKVVKGTTQLDNSIILETVPAP